MNLIYLIIFLTCTQNIRSEACSPNDTEDFLKNDLSTIDTRPNAKMNWVQLWEKAIQSSKNRQDLCKAITMYSDSIALLSQGGLNNYSFLFYERGTLHFKAGNYSLAIQDLTKALDSNFLSEKENYLAFTQRLAAYLFIGDFANFERDSKKIVDLWLPRLLYENDEYAVFTFKANLEGDSILQRTATSILLMQKWIDSEDQIVFSPSGKLIIKKSSQADSKPSFSFRDAFIKGYEKA